ncbi:hypothetical protein JKP88DRAFT_348073 [Tribonema minus]|uniref:Uncharacterized protein n=1 Tax=Tribonema minus TaxID=303371 RepID=A0A835Z3G5_9STRA|nr:hypothetical protein JKP88DRAFT_348073 [Tribonema minus]
MAAAAAAAEVAKAALKLRAAVAAAAAPRAAGAADTLAAAAAAAAQATGAAERTGVAAAAAAPAAAPPVSVASPWTPPPFRRLVVAMPTLLACSVESNLAPKIALLLHVVGGDAACVAAAVAASPALLGYSTHGRVAPRLATLQQAGQAEEIAAQLEYLIRSGIDISSADADINPDLKLTNFLKSYDPDALDEGVLSDDEDEVLSDGHLGKKPGRDDAQLMPRSGFLGYDPRDSTERLFVVQEVAFNAAKTASANSITASNKQGTPVAQGNKARLEALGFAAWKALVDHAPLAIHNVVADSELQYIAGASDI